MYTIYVIVRYQLYLYIVSYIYMDGVDFPEANNINTGGIFVLKHCVFTLIFLSFVYSPVSK